MNYIKFQPLIKFHSFNLSMHTQSKWKYFSFRIKFLKNFIEPEEAEWMFEQLKSEIPWEEKEITVWGGWNLRLIVSD